MSSRKPRTMAEWRAVFGGKSTASVIPHGAESRTIKKELRGKVPGTKNLRTGLWYGTTGSTIDRFMTEAEARQADKDGAAVGIWGQHFPGNDIDVDDADLADEIQALAVRILGPAPVRYREGSVRRLQMYAGNVRRRRIEWKTGEGKASAVELLGRGQYWNADGLHPSGKPYYWDQHPVDLGPHDLTWITQDQWDAFAAAVTALVESRGFKVVVSGASKAGGSTSGARTGLDDQSLWAPSPQAVLDLLEGYRPEVLGHNDFVAHMAAIKASLGEHREDYYPNVLEWAPGVRSTEDDATRKVWDSIDDAAIGWNWLVDKSGSPAAATADFKDPPPDDDAKSPEVAELERLQALWVFVGGKFYNIKDKGYVDKDTFNALHINLGVYAAPKARDTAVARMLNSKNTLKARTLTYRPKSILDHSHKLLEEPPGSGITAFNMWVPPNIIPIRNIEPSGPWFDHIHEGLPLAEDIKHFFDWWAFIFQNPGVKINHALMLISNIHGTGKDLAYLPFFYGLGMPQNVWTLRPMDLTGRFSSYLLSQVIYVSEMTDFSEKKSDYNVMKMLMASPPEYIPLEEKRQDQRMIPNIQNWVFGSNHDNPIALEPDDRRFWAQKFAVGHKDDPDHFNRIVEDIHEGTERIVGYVLDRDICHFNAKARPPMTEAKAEMIRLARSPAMRWLDEQFATGGQWEKKVFMTAARVYDASMMIGVPDAVSRSIHKGHIETALRQHGFELIEGKHRIDGNITRVWTRDKHFKSASGELLTAQVEADWKKR